MHSAVSVGGGESYSKPDATKEKREGPEREKQKKKKTKKKKESRLRTLAKKKM